MTGIAKAQTIKQAKASFAARGRPSLNVKEQKQLERSLELEQRTERAKEQEKRRVAAAKKRAENEVKSRAEREKAFLGTQRRKDRFGYVSSQFHMGAFLLGGEKAVSKEVISEEEEQEPDLFGDEDLDDEDMLNAALDAPTENVSKHAESDSAVFIPPSFIAPIVRRSQSAPTLEDMSDFWDDLESSTQIARELGETEMELPEKSASIRSGSFGSVDFDFTAEDLDQLDPPVGCQQPLPTKKETMPPPQPTNGMMPPPSIPARQTGKASHRSPPSAGTTSTMRPNAPVHISPVAPRAEPVPIMPPPVRPVARPVTSSSTYTRNFAPTKATLQRMIAIPPPPPPRRLQNAAPQQTRQRNAIKGPFLPASSLYCSPDLGFTLTQLESFVDDDIQLT